MNHKCKFVAHRRQRSRKRKTMSYKCHGCFKVLVFRKRHMHRAMPRPGYRLHCLTWYYDVMDSRYQEQARLEEESLRELFSYEFNHD